MSMRLPHEPARLKVAVIGGGTAGCMAAAHFTRYLPNVELYHVQDPRIPIIGVGEGTVPAFVSWLHDVTRLTEAQLQEQCLITRKLGILFENWGTRHRRFAHYFSSQEGPAYHISAPRIVELLAGYIGGTPVHKKVEGLGPCEAGAKLTFEDGTTLEVDFAIDARGFPPAASDRMPLPLIPTDAVIIRQGPAVDPPPGTRSIARPHGWVFVIPLTTHTSYGYVYNQALSTPEQVDADLGQLLRKEAVPTPGPPRRLTFPSFVHRELFDGAVFRIGNAASFLEPLEATAIGVILLQLRFVSLWVLDRLLGLSEPHDTADGIRAVNDQLRGFIQSTAVFVGWHYARGSAFDTPFWRHARERFTSAMDTWAPEELRREFDRRVAAGASMPEELALNMDPRGVDDTALLAGADGSTFGGFLDLSFAKLGHGIAYYAT